MSFLSGISGVGIAAIIGAVVLFVVIVVIGWYITTANTVIRLSNGVDEGWSTIDVSLKKRYDLIPNLVETVKGYAKHESSTLENVIKARNAAMSAGGIDDKAKAEGELSGTLKTLFALSEAYPNLKADSQFLDLQRQLNAIEGEIGNSRRYYNGAVKKYNNYVMVFPSAIVARRKGFEKRKFFEIDSSERQNVKVSFN